MNITTELYWLTLTITMTAFFWIPMIINRILETGVWATLLPPLLTPKAQWAERLKRAHANAVENLVVFAPLVLAIQVTNISTSATATACILYFFARMIHVIAYIAAVPLVRTLAFTVGFFSQMTLAVTLLKLI